MFNWKVKIKVTWICIAPFRDSPQRRSGMDHPVLPTNNPIPAFNLRMRSPGVATTNCGNRHLVAAYYSFIYPERMKGWVGLVVWPIADGLPTQVVTRQLSIERNTGKVRRSKTNVLPTQPNVKPEYVLMPWWSVTSAVVCSICTIVSGCQPLSRPYINHNCRDRLIRYRYVFVV